MPKRKHISYDLREANVAAHLSVNGYKVIFKLFVVHYSAVRKIVYEQLNELK